LTIFWENLAKISLSKSRVPEVRFAHTRQLSTLSSIEDVTLAFSFSCYGLLRKQQVGDSICLDYCEYGFLCYAFEYFAEIHKDHTAGKFFLCTCLMMSTQCENIRSY